MKTARPRPVTCARGARLRRRGRGRLGGCVGVGKRGPWRVLRQLATPARSGAGVRGGGLQK